MACSKSEKLNKVTWDHHVPSNISPEKIMEVCYISYSKACSIEIIDHLLGGPNLEFKPMELENLFDCYKYCKDHVLDFIKNDKKDIKIFEDRQSQTSNILVVITSKKRTSTNRAHIILNAVCHLTILVEPRVGICRYLNLVGKKLGYNSKKSV